MGLGSVGKESERLDDYSDLDFFVVAAPGSKMRLIDELDWLEEAHPLAYSFKNSADGHKIMFEDGVYGEFAVFEEREMEDAAYSGGRIIWKSPSYGNDGIVESAAALPNLRGESIGYAVNEALTNLYVGLCRYARGEKLSAVNFVENYAVDGLVSVMHLMEPEESFYPDRFGNDRRLERRYPQFAKKLGGMLQGYERVPESALQILNFLEENYPINAKVSFEVRRLANEFATM